MSYIALARKWRPRTFSQLLGQEHISKALTNSLNQNRLHHAYLFTGTRGVGKTSVARLLAKALNCEQGISADCCLQCEACQSIEQGRFIDLIEIDGASRTRVEDTREILENVQYAPTNARFKIYLIDEVHMLSQHSFNALLKTLEEPPTHVKFILATTDPQKLPATVLSRCLQFNLKHLQPETICHHLEQILQDEKLSYDKPALELLAKAAQGSMRDALSLLDQAIASSDHHLHTHEVKSSLGYTQQNYAIQLLEALAESNPQKLMSISKEIANESGHFHYVIDELLSCLHQIGVQQIIQDSSFICTEPAVQELCKIIAPEDVQLFYQIGIKALDELHAAPSMAIGFEMMLLRMHVFKPAPEVEVLDNCSKNSAPPIMPSNLSAKPFDSVKKSEDDTPKPANIELQIQEKPNETDTWETILPQLKLTGLALNAAENAELSGKSENQVRLRVAKGHQSIFTMAVINRIEQALTQYYKESIKLTIVNNEPVLSSPAQKREITHKENHQNAEVALQEDPFFQQLKQEFSAELVKNSITLIKDDL